MKNSKIFNVFLVLVGAVFGSFISTLCAGAEALSWLCYGATVGMKSPLSLDFVIVELSFSINFDLTIITTVCIIAALVIGRKLTK